MFSDRRELWLALPVPIIFTIAVLIYFILIPSESQTLGNLISYTSSVATISMVLIVIRVNSLQRKEMENTRLLQYQPVISLEPLLNKSYIEEPLFFSYIPKSKVQLLRRLFAKFKLENIGNGPALAVDIIPELFVCDEKGKEYSIRPGGDRIGSIKQNQAVEHLLAFFTRNENSEMTECMMKSYLSRGSRPPCIGGSLNLSHITVRIFYRNFLGAIFKQEMDFNLSFFDEDEEIIKNSLKFMQSIKIDFAKDLEKANDLFESDYDRANTIRKTMNDELSKAPEFVKTFFDCAPDYENFSIKQISKKEYESYTKGVPFGFTPVFSREAPKEMELDYDSHFIHPFRKEDNTKESLSKQS